GWIFISAFWALASYISLLLARWKKPHCWGRGMITMMIPRSTSPATAAEMMIHKGSR
ncbi:hypothetical protein GOODEAATRI_012093, partial [Goodea atripinnis]